MKINYKVIITDPHDFSQLCVEVLVNKKEIDVFLKRFPVKNKTKK